MIHLLYLLYDGSCEVHAKGSSSLFSPSLSFFHLSTYELLVKNKRAEKIPVHSLLENFHCQGSRNSYFQSHSQKIIKKNKQQKLTAA